MSLIYWNAFLCGNFDYNKTPLAPPGTKALVHKKPSDRKTWGHHRKEGWANGASTDHYRFICTYIPSMCAEIIFNTLTSFLLDIPTPQLTTENRLLQATEEIISILKSPIPHLSAVQNKNINKAKLEIAELLQRSATSPTLQANAKKDATESLRMQNT